MLCKCTYIIEMGDKNEIMILILDTIFSTMLKDSLRVTAFSGSVQR